MAADQPVMTQGRLAAALRRQRWLVVVIAVLGTAAGLAFGLVGSTTYTASASVLVTPLEGNPYSPQGRGDDLLNLETEAQLVKTDAVAKLARAKLQTTAFPGSLRARVSVSVPPNTQVLNIAYAGDSPVQARNGAQAFAEGYLEYRRQRTQNVLDGKLKKLQDSSERVDQALQNANKKLQGETGSQRSYWNTRIQGYTNQLGVIEEQSNDVRSTPINPGQVITPAATPGGPSARRPVMYAVAGLLAGLGLAVGLVAFRQRTERRLHTAEDVEQLGVPVLTTLPRPAPGDGSLALVAAPKGTGGDAYRRLRAAIVATAPQAPVIMLVTSATPDRSATLISSNLSVALAFAGAQTIMVDAATCDADPAPLFGLQQGRGLSDTLLNGVDPAELLVHVDSQLRLLPRGSDPREAAHRFSGPLMREAVKMLRRRAGFVVINADSVSDADAQALSVLADVVLLIVTPGVTTRDELEQAYAEAERAGTKVIGTVVDVAPPKRRKRGDGQGKAGQALHPAEPAARIDRPERADRELDSVRPERDQSRSKGQVNHSNHVKASTPVKAKPPKPAKPPRPARAAEPAKPGADDGPPYWPGLPAAQDNGSESAVETADDERETEKAKSDPGA